MKRLAELKLLLDIPQEETDRDFILLKLLELCERYALTYCRLCDAGEELSPVIVRMAMEDYGALGGEGISRRSFSGLTEDYVPNYSKKVLTMLNAYRKPGVLR